MLGTSRARSTTIGCQWLSQVSVTTKREVIQIMMSSALAALCCPVHLLSMRSMSRWVNHRISTYQSTNHSFLKMKTTRGKLAPCRLCKSREVEKSCGLTRSDSKLGRASWASKIQERALLQFNKSPLVSEGMRYTTVASSTMMKIKYLCPKAHLKGQNVTLEPQQGVWLRMQVAGAISEGHWLEMIVNQLQVLHWSKTVSSRSYASRRWTYYVLSMRREILYSCSSGRLSAKSPCSVSTDTLCQSA